MPARGGFARFGGVGLGESFAIFVRRLAVRAGAPQVLGYSGAAQHKPQLCTRIKVPRINSDSTNLPYLQADCGRATRLTCRNRTS